VPINPVEPVTKIVVGFIILVGADRNPPKGRCIHHPMKIDVQVVSKVEKNEARDNEEF
jgi:hypothetical protein